MVLQSYLRRETVKTMLAVFSVLLLVAISNKFVRLVSKAATGEISPELLAKLVGIEVPELAAFLLPLSLFLAILLTFGKFWVDHEMAAMLALGVGWDRFIRAVMGIAVCVSLISGGLALFCVPYLQQLKENTIAEEQTQIALQSLQPGRFHALENERLVYYMEDLSGDKKSMGQVFIAEQPLSHTQDNPWTVLSAKSGRIYSDPNNNQTYLELMDGNRYEGVPGFADYSRVSFQTYGRLIQESNRPPVVYHRSMSTMQLWRGNSNHLIAELQWRFALPLSVPLLALLALPLSKIRPRGGRFDKMLPGIIVYILYFNFLTVSRRWVASGVLSPWVGLWWVHLILAIAGIILLLRESPLHKLRLRDSGKVSLA